MQTQAPQRTPSTQRGSPRPSSSLVTVMDLAPLGSMAEAHYSLATILLLAERWDEADRTIRVALGHDPALALRVLTDDAFQRLRSRAPFRRELHRRLVQAGLL